MTWQPIETAPKDGSWIKVLGQNGKEDLAQWYDYRGIPFMNLDGEWNSKNGEGPFTHWMDIEEESK